MNGLSFSTQPTTGQYVQANDTLDAGPTLDPRHHRRGAGAMARRSRRTSGGAVVNWLPNPGEANLAVTQTVAPVPAPAGTRLTYTITVTNGGPAAAARVTLIPGVPLGATGVTRRRRRARARSGRAAGAARSATLRGGRGRRGDVSFIPATTGTLFTTASVSSQTPDSVIANNFHTIAASIVPAGQGVDLRADQGRFDRSGGGERAVHLHADGDATTARRSPPTSSSPTTCRRASPSLMRRRRRACARRSAARCCAASPRSRRARRVTMTFNATARPPAS